MKRTLMLALAIGLLLAWPISSFGDSISQLVVFGDSLSDVGNVYIATGGAEPAPPGYTAGLFTDGPDSSPATTGPLGVWVQQLGGMMGVVSPGPSLAGGNNYAFGGALTGYDPTFGSGGEPYVGDQVNEYLAGHSGTLPSNALYVFWAGANDLFTGVNSPSAAVMNISANISTLYGDGARNFLLLNMPPLGDTPDILALGPAEVAYFNGLSLEYNSDLSSTIAMLDADDPGIRIVGEDVYALVLAMLADPSAYGFVNTDTPAQGLSVDPNTYLFWDGVHPTTMGDYWVANLAYDDLTTPELPASLLFGTAVLALAFVFSRQHRASA
ncbi:MAG TPA: SGNH/GDSL hydrolase family protein [Terriglobia bacterium]|nr:SGNH/GDSL hydrolase family protein [Terriglobia bacterium]